MDFFHDVATTLHLQKVADATRNAFATAALTATGMKPVADLVSSIVQRYPHLTPGITLSLANAGYGPDHPITAAAADLAAQRKVDNGIGWNSIGDKVNPTHAGLLEIPGIHFPEAVGTTLKFAANAISTAIDDTAKTITAPVKPTLRILGAAALSVPQLADASMREVAKSRNPVEFIKNELQMTPIGISGVAPITKSELAQTTIGQSAASLASGNGLSLGHGYLPAGPAAQAATQASADSLSYTYADHPYFSLHDDPNAPATPHVATTGRIIAKTIIEPGSSLFSLVSGLIDAGKQIELDPTSRVLKTAGETAEAARSFSPTDLGPSTPQFPTIDPFEHPDEYQAQQLLINATRKTIDPVATANYLTEDAVGRKLVDKIAEEPSAYKIWRANGGLDGNMTPGLANSLSQVSTPEDVRGIMGPALGIDLLQKPALTRLGLAATDLSIRDRLDSIRLLNNVPSASPIDLEDHQQAAKQLVLHLRNAKVPDALVESSFNDMAAATTPIERANVLHNALNIDLPRHIIATDLDGITGDLDRNFARLRSAFTGATSDEAVWSQITRDQIATKQPIMGLLINGEEQALRSPYHDAEAVNRMFYPPDIREIRRVSSTYGRLLILSHAEVPLEVLDRLQNLWRGLSIGRISTALRITGQSQAEMAARGLSTPFGHLYDYIATASGRKLGTDILGEELSANKIAGFVDDARNVGTTSWANDIKQARQQVIPFYDQRFTTALAQDIYDMHTDPVTRRIAGFESTGDPISSTKTWLASDAAAEYRDAKGITADTISPYVDNLANTVRAKTLSQESLMAAIRDGEHAPGSPIYTQSPQGVRSITPGFKNHINSLVEKALTPDETIGNILTPVSEASKGILDRAVNAWMNKVLIGPINHWVTNPALRGYYYQELSHTLPLMSEEAQAAALKATAEAGLKGDDLKNLVSVAGQRSGDLSLEEGHLLTETRAQNTLKRTLYDQHDRKQVMDILRLVFPFGNAWAQQLKEWSSLLVDRPNIIPRAETLVHGAEGSGFFYIDPKTIQYDKDGNPIPGTGTETFAFPWSRQITKLITGAPFALTSPVSSLNMFSQNPLMPGFGPIAQTVVGHIIPDKPEYQDLRKLVAPFGSPSGLGDFLPSYMKKVQTAFSDPSSNRAFANTVGDVAKYLASTGQYDIATTDGQIKLEDAARAMAKRIYLFRGLAQFALPSAPTPEDVVKDANGQSVLTFKMAQDYYALVNDDKIHNTNLAVSRFIDEYGTKNILGMQSMTEGDAPLDAKGYEWVLNNPDLARKYSNTYSYFAPAGGGYSQQAYDMLFDKGKRKILTVSEAMQAANARVATMIFDNLKSQIGPRPNPAQSQWLASRKQLLIDKYPGWNPDYVGTKTPGRIRELENAVSDPKLANNPITPALQAYFHFRDQAIQSAGIAGWNTANSTVGTRNWLREKAAAISARVPEFQRVFDDLLTRELKDDSGS